MTTAGDWQAAHQTATRLMKGSGRLLWSSACMSKSGGQCSTCLRTKERRLDRAVALPGSPTSQVERCSYAEVRRSTLTLSIAREDSSSTCAAFVGLDHTHGLYRAFLKT